jgi:hypothetical protein
MLDTIAVAGWDNSIYPTNPVVLSGHNSDMLPVGRAIWTGIEGGRLKSKMIFGSDEFAQRVKRMVDERIIRTASVGFTPGKWEFSKDRARQGGIDFISGHRLLEWSIVNIPANPRCLLEGVEGAKGATVAIEQAQVPPAATPFADEARRRIAENRRKIAEYQVSSDSSSQSDEAVRRIKARLARIQHSQRRVNK